MNSTHEERIRRLRSFATLLDAAIPLPGGFRVGLDPIIGLIPGLGDAIGAALAAFIVIEAINLRASLSVVLRMIGNIVLDVLIGAIPLLGDIFDFAFKANLRNVALLERHLLVASGAPRRPSAFLIMAALISALVLLAIITAIVFLVAFVFRALL
jgi:hypothetical protein